MKKWPFSPLVGNIATVVKSAIFPTREERSNSFEIIHFPVSKQTVEVQFSLDVLGNSYCFTSGGNEQMQSSRLKTGGGSKIFTRCVGKNNAFRSWGTSYCFTSGESEQLPMSVKFANRAEGECCIHTN